MSTTTDPAKELADLCQRLRGLRPDVQGFQVLAAEFGVPSWSAEFYELVFTIVYRIDQLKEIINNLELVDEDIRDQACAHLDVMTQAFSQGGLNSQWSHAVTNFISPEHVNPILFISSEVRRIYAYPKLSDLEKDDLLQEISDLLSWLRDFQIKEQDFIRQALIDGLESFHFRVERISWVGWGYTVESLRAVIGAYLALERGLDPTHAPDGQAVLQKVGAVLKSAFETIGVVKDVSERANWLIEGYKNISAVTLAGKGIVGLLTFAGAG